LLVDLLYSSLTTAIIVGATGLLFGWLWFGLALTRLASGKREW
jgi:hypothetical protein